MRALFWTEIKFTGPWVRLVLCPGTVLLYVPLLFALYPFAGRGAFALSFLPVAIASFAGGRSWGFLHVFLILLCNYIAGTYLFAEASLPSALMGAVAQSLLVLGIGHLLGLRDRLKATILEKDAAMREARRFAMHDTTTGLPNRRLMVDRLERELAHARRNGTRLGVLFLDLDGFKLVNDTLGHQAGDRMLYKTAGVLKEAVRESDTVARVGGDEFVVLLPGIRGPADASPIAERMLAGIRRLGNGLGSSIGISVFPEDGADGEILIRNADSAMYTAKEAGKNTIRYWDQNQHSQLERRWRIEKALQAALAMEQFVLFYQPVLDIQTGRVTGLEALIRWEHPEEGRIPPDVFIPVVERNGLIIEIGEWALRRAAADMMELVTRGLVLERMSVNIATAQLISRDFPERVREILGEIGLLPALLELEVTETGIALHGDRGKKILSEIRDLGVTIALDDFGVGNSSLRYLASLPIDTLKIDRTFVQKIHADHRCNIITHTMISLGKNLQLNVVAEGVETEAQRRAMFAMGCDSMQGYLFRPAVPFAEICALLSSQKGLPEIRFPGPETREPATPVALTLTG